jgi:PAS domain S-box-containing protein
MIAALRRLSWLDRVAAAYAAVYVAWHLGKAMGFAVPSAVGELAFYPLGVMVAWLNWRNAGAAGLDRRTRIAWRLLALSAIVLWLSGSAWTLWIALGGAAADTAWTDKVGFAEYVLSIAGYLYFPRQAVPRKSLARFVLDVSLIVVAGFVIAIYLGLKLLLHDPTETATMAVVESSLDWALFAVAAVGCMQKRDPVIRQALVLLLSSNLAALAGNYLYAVRSSYQSGDPVDLVWFSAWVLRWAAARTAWWHYRLGHVAEASSGAALQEYRGNPFSYVMVGGAFALLLRQILADDHQMLGTLTFAAVLMGGLLIFRQFAELEENRRLYRAQVERESRFTALVRNSSDVVLVVNPEGIVTDVSPSVTRVFGGDGRLTPGIPFQALLAERDAGIADMILARLPPAGRRFETRMQVAPGRWREVEAVWSDLRDDPVVRGVVLNCRDVTDRNEVERQLRQTQESDAVGHLAGGLAHDLNNVLAIIRGYTELLRSELPDGSPAGSDVDHIVAAVDRAAAVTGKVLAFTRKQPGEKVVLDLNLVVRELEPMLRQLMTDQVAVRLDLDPGLWPVRADQRQLEQVLVNLATNARDAMPAGGEILIRTENLPQAPEPSVAGSPWFGDGVSVRVVDRGGGMSPAVMARIFEPFFTTKPKDRGLGLGLAIVRGIVADLDGRVLVESAEGQGSTLTVLLPRADTQ